jgi:phage tail-like protein
MGRDEHLALRFWVTIDGVEVAGFASCSPVVAETETFDYAEGGSNVVMTRLPVRTKHPNVTLRRGLDPGQDLYRWCEQIRSAEYERRNISITIFGPLGDLVKRYDLVGAYPVKWTGPQLRTETGEVAFESVEFAYERIIEQRAPAAGSGAVAPDWFWSDWFKSLTRWLFGGKSPSRSSTTEAGKPEQKQPEPTAKTPDKHEQVVAVLNGTKSGKQALEKLPASTKVVYVDPSELGGINGDYTPGTDTIRVRNDLSPEGAAGVLAHEATHADQINTRKMKYEGYDALEMEVEANRVGVNVHEEIGKTGENSDYDRRVEHRRKNEEGFYNSVRERYAAKLGVEWPRPEETPTPAQN